MANYERVVARLGLPRNFSQFIQQQWGISKLHPPQAEALPHILAGRNTMLCIPTASGKTLVAFIAIINQILVKNPGSRAIYIVPLKALASEKLDELREVGEHLGLKIGLGIGDSPREARQIDDCDILVCTSEKLDSLMRSKPEILRRVSTVIADEFHLLNDSQRGPTMEINLARIKHLIPETQIITLSATVGNSQDLADWLDSELVVSDWRPVSLEYSTLAELDLEPRAMQKGDLSTKNKLNPPRTLDGPKSHVAWAALKDVHSQDGQLLVFVSTRRSAQSEAKKLSKRMYKHLQKENPAALTKLHELSKKLSSNSNSSMGDSLADCVKGGIAFHHAGLTHKQRSLIENAFKQRTIHCLCATPTLAAGVNLPARRVLVRDLKRFDDGMSRLLPVMEVRQMLGRAGRPRYDPCGEAWLACKGGDPRQIADEIADRYFHGPIEDITSKLAAEPAMRFHLLSSIATGGLHSRESIGEFFSGTYLGHSQPNSYLQDNIDSMLRWLVDKRFIRRRNIGSRNEDWDDDIPSWVDVAKSASGVEMIKERVIEPSEATFGFRKASNIEQQIIDFASTEAFDTEYEATDMGQKVAQLYIDPLSADILIEGLRRAVRRIVRNDFPVTEFGLCHLVAATPDFLSLWPKSSELDFGSDLRQRAAIAEDELLIESPLDERAMGLVKSAWCTEMWYNEEDLRNIEKKLGVTPGDVHSRIDLMTWLLYASKELLMKDDIFAKEHLQFVTQLVGLIELTRLRVKAGCKEDLLNLVQVRNVGRSRARTLSEMGMRTPADLLSISSKDLDKLKSMRGWGPILVEKILDDVRKFNLSQTTKKSRDDDEPLPGERQY